MSEFSPFESPASQEQKREKALENFSSYAKTHLNTLLSAQDWAAARMSDLYSYDLPENGAWVIYCKDYQGHKNLGAKIYGADGALYDQIEYTIHDSGVPFTSGEEVKPEYKPKPKERKEGTVPEGEYRLTVTYVKRDGQTVTRQLSEVRAYGDMTKEDLLKNARGWISMTGLHNFGLKVSYTEPNQLVHFRLEHEKGAAAFESDCRVDINGHIVKGEESV